MKEKDLTVDAAKKFLYDFISTSQSEDGKVLINELSTFHLALSLSRSTVHQWMVHCGASGYQIILH